MERNFHRMTVMPGCAAYVSGLDPDAVQQQGQFHLVEHAALNVSGQAIPAANQPNAARPIPE